MGLPNLVFQGKVDVATLGPLGLRRLKSGLYSFKPEQDGVIKRWHLGKGEAKAYIHSYVEALSHDFGNYTVHFRNYGFSYYNDGSYPTSMNVSGQRHPHFNGDLCWGNMGSSRDYALRRHDIETVAGLVGQLLSSYYPNNPYGGWWIREDVDEGRVCIECGYTYNDEEHRAIYSCASCQSWVCENCVVRCEDAYQRDVQYRFCRACLKDNNLCLGENCRYHSCFMHPTGPAQMEFAFEPMTDHTTTTGSGPGYEMHTFAGHEHSAEYHDEALEF